MDQNNKSKTAFLSSKHLMVLLSFLGLYLISAGTSWALFSYLKDEPRVSYSFGDLSDTRSQIEDLPKTEECPINGQMFTEPERAIWETRRPITVIIENHLDSRPLEGLHRADVVYEAVAEGGITRHLGVFYCGASREDVRIAPVRSARVHFITWAAEYGDNPIFTHVGGANNICGTCPGGVKLRGQVDPRVRAIEMLSDLGWRVPQGNDFDTTYDTGFPVLFRDPERLGHPIASEHTMVSMIDAIFEEAEKRGYAYEDSEGKDWDENFQSWNFTDEAPLGNPKASNVTFEYWSNNADYAVEWKYSPNSNTYNRFVGGVEARDLSSDEPFTAKVVIVQFVDETGPVDSEKHMFYKTIGTGDALIFQNGDVIEATWEKDDTTGRTIYFDEGGNELSLVRGQIWIHGVPTGNEVSY